jgi:hypothetical protein
MDQAASVISTTNSALYVSFFPRLSAQPIPLPGASTTSASPILTAAALPPRAVFVCANSLVVSDKVVHARTRYNLRVVETLVAARILARKLNISVGDREKVTLREVLGRLVGEDPSGVGMDLGVLMKALERMGKEVEVLKPESKSTDGEEGTTLEEMIEWSGLSEEVFREVYLSWVDGSRTHSLAFTYLSLINRLVQWKPLIFSSTNVPNTFSQKLCVSFNFVTCASVLLHHHLPQSSRSSES